jgi:hypothetical protein
MPAAAIVSIVLVLVVAAAVAAVVLMRGGTGIGRFRLRRRFGAEYERVLVHHEGDERATRHELAQRVKRYGRLEIRPLAAGDAERFTARWAELKARFVDSPAEAVAEADRLIGRLAERRGFPGQESPEHNDALSVHYPHQLHAYRRAHALAVGDPAHGPDATEELRRALVAAREMFDALLGGTPAARSAPDTPPGTAHKTAPETAHETAPAGAADGARAEDTGGGRARRAPLGHRLAALTGSAARKDRTGAAG